MSPRVPAALIIIGAAWAYARHLPDGRTPADRPIEVLGAGYAGSAECRACHPHEYATWHASYHRTMTRPTSDPDVRALIGNAEMTLGGWSYRISCGDGDDCSVEIGEPPDVAGARTVHRRPLALVTGSHHMRICWFVADEARKLSLVPFAYILETKQWVLRQAAFLKPASVRFSREPGRWNADCIQCHVTQGRPRLAGMDSQASELGIACEACHGPAERHVRLNRDPVRRYARHLAHDGDPSIVNPLRLAHDRASQVCGQCHAVTYYGVSEHDRLIVDGWSYRPGADLAATRHALPDAKDGSHFWPDGMIRVTGREYNGLLRTACYVKGEMSCFSCHSLHMTARDTRAPQEWADHQLKPGMDGPAACLSCHAAFAAREKREAHTHHKADSPGSDCYNCHMPYTTYGLLKAVRSHQIDSPSVAVSLATGRPNACNQCHLDKPLAWTARALEAWYGIPEPPLDDEARTTSAAAMWALTGDAGQRALMAWSFGWAPALEASGTRWIAPYLAQLLEDPYPAVRFIAYRSLRRHPGFADFDFDFIGSDDDLAAVRSRVLDRWSRVPGAPDSARDEATLVAPDGTIRAARFDALVKRRNDAQVDLKE